MRGALGVVLTVVAAVTFASPVRAQDPERCAGLSGGERRACIMEETNDRAPESPAPQAAPSEQDRPETPPVRPSPEPDAPDEAEQRRDMERQQEARRRQQMEADERRQQEEARRDQQQAEERRQQEEAERIRLRQEAERRREEEADAARRRENERSSAAAATSVAPSNLPPSRTYSDRYPHSGAQVDTVDRWSFYHRECTSYIAWRVNHEAGTTSPPFFFHNTMGGGRWSDAGNWDENARQLGYRVDTVPLPGAIAHWEASEIGSVGHVAYVERVNPDGSVDVTEYNVGVRHGFGYRLNVRAPRYIHLGSRTPEPRPSAPPPGASPPTRPVQPPPAPPPAPRPTIPAPPAVSTPAVPGNLSPGSASSPGSTTGEVSVRLNWDSVAGAAEYDLGVRDTTTNQLVVDRRVNGSSFRADLAAGRSYRWNVRACNSAGCSDFTPPFHFRTPAAVAPTAPSPQPPPPSRLTATVPAVPGDPSPGNSSSPGSTASGASVRLNWNAVPGADEYDLGIRDVATNRLVVDRRVNGSSFRAALEPGRQYVWNVRACNAAGCSAFTRRLYFRTPSR